MSANGLILALRIAAALLLYLFLLGAVIVVWRDWRATARESERTRTTSERPLGTLIVVEGGDTDLPTGHAFSLSAVTALGRAPTSTVMIEDGFASSQHALLSLRGGRWWLEDLRSKNGTRLNGERLNAPAIVVTGDEIGIGTVRLRLELA